MNLFQKKYQRGVGLIEVLVTLLVLSTSLMALATLQTRSLQFNQGSYFMSQANILAYDILDRIRINDKQFAAYTVAAADAVPALDPVAAMDITQWRKILATTLPSSGGAISCIATTKVCTITITWTDLDSMSKNGTVSSFSYSSRI